MTDFKWTVGKVGWALTEVIAGCSMIKRTHFFISRYVSGSAIIDS